MVLHIQFRFKDFYKHISAIKTCHSAKYLATLEYFPLIIFLQSPADNVKPFPHLRHNSPSGHCHLTIPTQRIKIKATQAFSRFYFAQAPPHLLSSMSAQIAWTALVTNTR